MGERPSAALRKGSFIINQMRWLLRLSLTARPINLLAHRRRWSLPVALQSA